MTTNAILIEQLEARFPWLKQEDGLVPHSFSEDVEKLRRFHTELKDEAALKAPMDDITLADLAFDIADEHSAELIDSCCISEEIDGEKWLAFGDRFTSAEQTEQMIEDCSNEIDYLEARGLLHRHPEHKDLVRIEEGWR